MHSTHPRDPSPCSRVTRTASSDSHRVSRRTAAAGASALAGSRHPCSLLGVPPDDWCAAAAAARASFGEGSHTWQPAPPHAHFVGVKLHQYAHALRGLTRTSSNVASFYGSSCANNGKDALNTPIVYKRSYMIYIERIYS
eukprot:2246742-Pyramimonas_sp.AAC.2